jgi:sulfur-oxidizing protein SoxY
MPVSSRHHRTPSARTDAHDVRRTRREIVTAALAVASLPVALTLRPRTLAAAEPGQLARAIRAVAGDARIEHGRVTLELPELAENGFSVPLTVAVDSPMTAADHVKSIAILSEKNPEPHVARFHLGPRTGRARIRAHMRLADTQTVVALAVMSDGRVFQAAADVIVTISACTDAG